MFGYIRAEKPEMKVKDAECYAAVYCGLCHAMGRCTGCFSRLSLSYDVTFLLLFRSLLRGEMQESEYKRCIAHPIRKRQVLKKTAETEYCSYAAGLLTYYKLLDDCRDEAGKKRFLARRLLPSAKRIRQKALKRGGLRDLDEEIAALSLSLSKLEEEQVHSVDAYAEISGEMLAKIFAFGFSNDGGAKYAIAQGVGKRIGKWVYLLDAYDDMGEDFRYGRFNPFLLGRTERLSEEEQSALGERLRVALQNELSEVEAIFDLVEMPTGIRGLSSFYAVLENILYLGMPNRCDALLKEKGLRREKDNDNREGPI